MNDYGSKKIPFIFIISFDCNANYLFPVDEVPGTISYKIGDVGNCTERPFKSEFSFSAEPVGFGRYSEAFALVMKNLLFGNTYLLNLTFPSTVKTDLSLEEIYHLSKARYKLLTGDFVCFSPETFVRIDNGTISSNPMKGTIDAGVPGALEAILNNEKETAEHYTIVDLIRNDQSIVATEVKVERFRYPDFIRTNNKDLIQISSEIRGKLPDNYNSIIGDIIFSLLPAGSVTGAPKKKTVEIILEAEKYNRGYYTGVFGCFDGVNLDSAVMIRFIEKTEEGLVYKSGGGITAMSKIDDEYRELIDKIYVPVDRND